MTTSPFWKMDDGNPIIAPGQLNPQYDQRRAGAAHVIMHEDSLLMTYWGSNDQGNHILQAQATPGNCTHWRPISQPLLSPQSGVDHNHNGPGFPFFLPVDDSYWLLYFCGWGKPKKDGKLPNTTGVATSKDRGKSWHYHDKHPIIALDQPYDQDGTGSVWILHEQGRFRMYYTAISHYEPKPESVSTGHGDIIPKIGIGYAESEDGINWHKPFNHWLIEPREFAVDPYEYIVSKPCVIHDGRRYHMWVNTFGTAYRVHRLSSSDGIDWQWEERQGPDGELGTGAKGSFDDHQRSYPTILMDNGTLHCWFTGNQFGNHGMGYACANSEILNS